MKKPLLLLGIFLSFLSCDGFKLGGAPGVPGSISSQEIDPIGPTSNIQYHSSNSCDGNKKDAWLKNFLIDRIETELSQKDIDKCVNVVKDGTDYGVNIWIVNDADKTWLVMGTAVDNFNKQ